MSGPQTAAGRALSVRMVGNETGWLDESIVAIEREAAESNVCQEPIEPIYIDRLREAVDLALFDAEEGHSHPACRATFRRVAMAAFDAEAATLTEGGNPR